MAYVTGDTILDDEYNNFVGQNTSPFGWNVSAGQTAAASGNYDQGLGQTNIATVAATNTITAAQWNSLFTGMSNIATHTGDTLSSTAAVDTGNTIAVKAALADDLATLSSSIANGCPNTTALTTSAALQTSASSTRWAGSHVVEHTVNFTNANEARWFFNAGGKIQINISRTGNGGSSATSKDSSVDELITGLGDFKMASKASTRTGSTETVSVNGLAIGFHDLTTSYQTVLQLTQDSGTYTSMYFQIEAKADAAAGSATAVTIKVSIVDPDAGDGEFTAGNTSGVDQYANFIGTTNVILKTVNPNTTEGLATAYTPSSTVVTSNTTA